MASVRHLKIGITFRRIKLVDINLTVDIWNGSIAHRIIESFKLLKARK